jgi:IS30 family transposase
MPRYHRLNVNEREEIAIGIAQGRSQHDIAASLGRSPSTIYHEINRNTRYGQQYRAIQALRRTNRLTHTARKKRKMDINEPLKQYILKQLGQLWSPEQIAKRLKILYPMDMAMQISPESIYSYLYVKAARGITQRTSQMFTAQAHKPPSTRRQVPSELRLYTRLYKH